jgi:hypothetical protein
MANFFPNGNGGAPQQQQQQQQQQAPMGTNNPNNVQNNMQQHQQTQNNAAVVDNGQQAANAPLAEFSKMWDTANTGNGDAAAAAPKGYLPELTAEAVGQQLAKSNFTGTIPQEQLQKALGGDIQAFNDVLNSVARTVMSHSVLASRNMTELGINTHNTRISENLPSMVRSNNVTDKLLTTELYRNPAARPVIDSIRTAMERQHPQAPAEEIATHVDNYLKQFSAALGGNNSEQRGGNKSQASGEIDWFAAAGLDR